MCVLAAAPKPPSQPGDGSPTSRVIVFPVRVLTKICILAFLPPSEETRENVYLSRLPRKTPRSERLDKFILKRENELTTGSLLMADHEKRAFGSCHGVFCTRLQGVSR